MDPGDSVVKVACGRAHSLALTKTGSVFTLGNNSYGQCGRPVIAKEDYSAQAIVTRLQAEQQPVTQIECGQDTSFLVSSDGGVYSCGWGADGQTGRGHYNNEPTLGRLAGDLQGVNIKKVSCRADCAIALSDKGEVFGWGNNEYQQLVLATSETQLATPTHLPMPPAVGKVVDVAASGTACFIVNDRGELYSWGYGALGRGPANLFSQEPLRIPPTLLGNTALSPGCKVVSVTCGVHIVAALNERGEIFTWGRNIGGSLGQGHDFHQSFPVKVCVSGRVFKASCGVDHMATIAKPL
uniref:Williams-Beuren syndrome chromosomal region 16 protein homolog n=1 Tax=Hirondellea gigas TaxID=1518452 RepID=A0A2P2HZK5_9CRUS